MPENQRKITYATVCSGIECMSAAVGPLGGWEPVFFSEIEAFPSSLLAHRYPTVPNLGDMTKITAERAGENAWRITNGERTIELDHRLDVLAGGTPCFVAGTMVLTETGYRPIETLKVGDRVLTHKHRLRPIVRVGSKMAGGIVDARFATRGVLRCTDYHPFPMSERHVDHKNRLALRAPEKTQIKDGAGKYGFIVDKCEIERPYTPPFPSVYDASAEQIAELIGWYLGDGYIRGWRGKPKKAVVLCLNDAKLDRFKARFGDAVNYTVTRGRTACKVQICCTALADFLSEHFGELSGGKRIPLWCYTMGEGLVSALLDGYYSTDGSELPGGRRFTTVSPALAFGVADLFRRASVARIPVKPTCVIEGRVCNQRTQYCVSVPDKPRLTHITQHGTAVKCREVTRLEKSERVFNIEVEEDHTYVANGIITKNCQDVSVAGKRKGMAEGSGTRSSLAFHFARLCRELQPRWVVWENVPGVLTSNGGRDFAHFVRSIGECGYSLAYRTLDAQYVRVDGLPRAVPQRRRRVWLVGMRTVGHTGDGWRAPAEILFEPQGVRGDTPPRRVTGQGFTRPPKDGSRCADSPLPTNSNGGDVMPALTARDLEARLTGQADRSGGYVLDPSGFDPYEPGGVKSESPELSGALVNGSSPGFHNAVCFENHQTDARTQQVDVAPTMGATHNAQAANNNPLVVVPTGGVVAIDMDKNKPTNADKPVRKGGAGFGVSEKGASYTLTARDQHAVAYAIDSMGSNAMKSKNPHSGCREVECAPTLTTVDSAPVKHQGGTAVVAFLPGNSAKAQGLGAEEEVSPTLVKTQGESGNKVAVATECIGVFDMEAGKSSGRADTSGVSPTILALHGTDPHAVAIGFNAEAGTHQQEPHDELGDTLAASHKCGVAIGLDRASFNQGKNAQFGFKVEEECAPTVVAKGPGAVSFEPGIAKREGALHRFSDEVTSTLRSDMGDNLPAVAVDYIVRRLTPLECERLQGLPDGYTKIPHRGKPAEECPDTPRYKALGNGWAVNCARWICQRIQNYDKEHEQENTDGNE